MANITNVINISLQETAALASTANLNMCAVITSSSAVLKTSERYRTYSTYADFVADFGSTAQAAPFASAFFASNPNPISSNGRLVVWFWRSATETIAATSGKLTGAALDVPAVIAALQSISDGKFAFTADGGTEQEVTDMDFRTSTTLAQVASVITTAIALGANPDEICTVNAAGNGLVITSTTTGASSTMTFASSMGVSGTFVGLLLGLSSGSGAVVTAGTADTTADAETKLETLSALIAAVRVYGACFCDAPTDADGESADSVAVATWAQANNTLVYEVFHRASHLEVATTNPVWLNKLASRTNYRMLYSAAANRSLAAAYMARVHTVNFNAENAALTMNLKALPVTAESYTQSEIDKAKVVGLDLYTTVKDLGVVLTSGANDFVDNRYNYIGYVDALQTDLFNLLKATGTKVPQTTKGVNQLVDQCERTTQRFVRAGVFAPGSWSATDYFGDQTTFDRNINEFGYYFLAGKLSDQSPGDRALRKSPVVQGAVKNAGAVHSVDALITLNI